MVGLYVLSGQESYSRVATTCNIGGKGDVSKIVSRRSRDSRARCRRCASQVERFIFAVCELENEEVRFPTDADRAALHAGFKARRSGQTKAPRGLPLCAGAIGGTHVRPVSVNFVSVFYDARPRRSRSRSLGF